MTTVGFSSTARYLLLSSAVVLSACIIPPSLQPTESPNQQVTFVASEMEPVPLEPMSDDTIVNNFRLVADDADAGDTLQVRLLRGSDDGKTFERFSDATMTDAMISAHPTWRSSRLGANICGLFHTGHIPIATVVTDRAFANSVDETVVDGATSNRYDWVFVCP